MRLTAGWVWCGLWKPAVQGRRPRRPLEGRFQTFFLVQIFGVCMVTSGRHDTFYMSPGTYTGWSHTYTRRESQSFSGRLVSCCRNVYWFSSFSFELTLTQQRHHASSLMRWHLSFDAQFVHRLLFELHRVFTNKTVEVM